MLDAIRKHAVRRIVCITGIGAGDSRGHGGFFCDRVIEPTLLHTSTRANIGRMNCCATANETVIVRPGQLTHDDATGKYRVLLHLTGITVGKVTRADVAAFPLQQLSSDDFLQKTPLPTV